MTGNHFFITNNSTVYSAVKSSSPTSSSNKKHVNKKDDGVKNKKDDGVKNNVKERVKSKKEEIVKNKKDEKVKNKRDDSIKNKADNDTVNSTCKIVKTKKMSHAQFVDALADAWSSTYKNISNPPSKAQLKRFIEKLYKIADDLKITKTNNGVHDSRYPSSKDQIVDELCGIFANESQFSSNAISKNGVYHGLFQMKKETMDDLKEFGTKLPIVSMNEFCKLPITKQLDYFKEYIKLCKSDKYSKIENSVISPKQVYAMVQYPKAGKPNSSFEIPLGNGRSKTIRTNDVISQKSDTIRAKIKEREKVMEFVR